MSHPLQLAGLLLVGLLLSTVARADFLGRRVSEVLDELRAEGYTFIYNTQIVPADLRVTSEPRTRKGVELAREILAQHGLALSQAAPRVYAIVAGTQPQTAPTQADLPTAVDSTLEEIVVQTSRYTLAVENVATQTFLTQEQVKDMPRLADETLRAVQRLPGTAINGFSSIGPVRGGEPNETAILLDGLRLYEPFHLKNFLSPVSLLDSRLIDRHRVLLRRLSRHLRRSHERDHRRDQRAARAIALLRGRPEPVPRQRARRRSTFADGRGHALVSGRRSNVGDLAHFSENDFGEPEYSDGFGRVDYRIDDATRAAFDVLVSSDRDRCDQGRRRRRPARARVSQRVRVGDARSRLVAACLESPDRLLTPICQRA